MVETINPVIPPRESSQDYGTTIGIIQGLSSDEYLKEAWYIFNGFIYDYSMNRWIPFRKPIMNQIGISNIMKCLHSLSRINFSNMEEKRIPKFIFNFFMTNYPTFIIYHKEFDLDPKDFNIIETELFHHPLANFYNAKNAGHRNVVRGTLSENVLLRNIDSNKPQEEKQKRGILSFLRNPLGSK